MKTLNLLKTLFMNNLYNPPAFVRLAEENEELFEDFQYESKDRIGYNFNRECLSEISLNLLLISHDSSEIWEILEAFGQLRGDKGK